MRMLKSVELKVAYENGIEWAVELPEDCCTVVEAMKITDVVWVKYVTY